MQTAALTSRPNTNPHASEATDNTADPRLKVLPTPAKEKFEKLRRAELRSRALIDGLYDESRRVSERHTNAARLLGSFDRQYSPEASFTYKEDEKTGRRERVPTVFPERVALVEQIERCKAEHARLADEQQAANLGFATDNIIDWLASQSPSTKFITAPVSLLKLNKGENFTDALAHNREAQAAINAELATVQNAGRTITEAKTAMRAQVDLLVEKGRPDVAGLFHGGAVVWPTEMFSADGHGHHPHTVTATVNDTLAFAAWAHRAAIIAQLDAEIERAGDDANALSAEAQATRVAELQASLLQLQRQQEAIAERLEGDGIPVRRTCTDPVVLLGIEQLRQ